MSVKSGEFKASGKISLITKTNLEPERRGGTGVQEVPVDCRSDCKIPDLFFFLTFFLLLRAGFSVLWSELLKQILKA